MLVSFRVENYRSYREGKTLSMVASNSGELPQNLIDVPEYNFKLLRTAVLYGPNASGKSNLLYAMNYLSDLLGSPLSRDLRVAPRSPHFALNATAASRPTSFSTSFIFEKVLYEYSIAYHEGMIIEERFVAFPQSRPQTWFLRNRQDVEFNKTYLRGRKQALRTLMQPGIPLLAVAAAFDHPQMGAPAGWIMGNLRERFATSPPHVVNPRSRISAMRTARLCEDDPQFREWVNAFLVHADLGIRNVEVEITREKVQQPFFVSAPDGSQVQEIREVHRSSHTPVFVHAGEDEFITKFNLADESLGTQRLFGMLSEFYLALSAGRPTVVDELTASIHPSLVRVLIGMFHDAKVASRNAQLVFTTHDTSLLSGRLFRRDQVWFTEKDRAGATDLYSLHDVKDVRADDSFEKGYLRGRYGAIPFFREFDFPPSVKEATTFD
ncbi:MAG: ATP-binding protein [Isosphaeraceae bacterium]